MRAVTAFLLTALSVSTFAAARTATAQDAGSADLASLANGQSIRDVAQSQAPTRALTRVMGPRMVLASRRRILEGAGGQVEDKGDFVIGSTCVPHDCGINETAWAFDHSGHAWASWTSNRRTTYYGNPPPAVRRALTPITF